MKTTPWILYKYFLLSYYKFPKSSNFKNGRVGLSAGGCFWCVEADFETNPRDHRCETISGLHSEDKPKTPHTKEVDKRWEQGLF